LEANGKVKVEVKMLVLRCCRAAVEKTVLRLEGGRRVEPKAKGKAKVKGN
jgi:hypothetical protein